ECTIVFFSCLSAPSLSHCPIQGPQALVNTFVPNFSKVSMMPSLSMVYLICSDPGLIPNSAFGVIFLSNACCTIDTARDISSYDELVQEPLNPHSTFIGQPFSAASVFILETGVPLSGVNGPLICGSNSDKLISMSWSKYFSGSAYTSGSAVR